MAPFCRNCGQDMVGNPRICPHCGLEQDSPAPGPIQGPQQGSWVGRGFGGGFGAAVGWIVGSCLVLFLVGLLFVGCTVLLAAAGGGGG